MALAKDTGFLLRKIPYSESSLILKVFTREGLISLIAKGARRPASRLRGLLEPALHLQFLYPAQTRSELKPLAEVSLLQDFPGLRSDPGKLGLAQVFGEVLLRYHPGAAGASDFHDLLLLSLEDLEAAPADKESLQARLCAFLLRFCRVSGFQPQFRRCMRCEAPVEGTVAFHLDQGGPLCGRHAEDGTLLLRPSLAGWLDALQNGRSAASADRLEAWRAETFLLNYLGRHSGGEKKLRALGVWHAVMAEAA